MGKFISVVWDPSLGFFIDRCEPSSSAAIFKRLPS